MCMRCCHLCAPLFVSSVRMYALFIISGHVCLCNATFVYVGGAEGAGFVLHVLMVPFLYVLDIVLFVCHHCLF